MARILHKKKRAEIKRILALLTDRNRYVFMLMYSHTDLSRDIEQVVDEMPNSKIKWAYCQVTNTYHKIFRILAND